MRYLLTVTVTATMLLIFTLAHSEIYSWKGENGTVNFSDDPAKIPKEGRRKITTTVRDEGNEAPINEFVYEMRSNVMENAIYEHDKLTINKNISTFKQNDIVAYKYAKNDRQIFIGRIIGVPGNVIKITNKIIYINDNRYHDQYGIHKDKRIIPATENPRDNNGPKRLNDNEFFVLGDNRDWSYDSRFMRPLRKEEIVGKVIKIERHQEGR